MLYLVIMLFEAPSGCEYQSLASSESIQIFTQGLFAETNK